MSLALKSHFILPLSLFYLSFMLYLPARTESVFVRIESNRVERLSAEKLSYLAFVRSKIKNETLS